MEAICVRVKELRKKLELSQVEFARNLGVTNAHISKIEKGKTIPSDSLIKLISKEYQVSEDWLKEGIKPIFIHEVMDQTEEYLIDSTITFNKLLSSDSYVLRGVAAELKFSFSSITDVSNLEEQQKIGYLNVVRNMFSIIAQYNFLIKEQLFSRQLFLDDVMEEHFKDYKIKIENCINEYQGLMVNIRV